MTGLLDGKGRIKLCPPCFVRLTRGGRRPPATDEEPTSLHIRAQSCLASALSNFLANNWPTSKPRCCKTVEKDARGYRGQSLPRCTSDPGGWFAKIVPLMIYWFPITLIFNGHAGRRPPVSLAKKFNLQSVGERRKKWKILSTPIVFLTLHWYVCDSASVLFLLAASETNYCARFIWGIEKEMVRCSCEKWGQTEIFKESGGGEDLCTIL